MPGRIELLTLVPLRRPETQEFVREHHRHSKPPVGDVIRVGVELEGQLVGVAMAGRPVARALDDKKTLEVLRVCVLPGTPGNPNSKLYGALIRAGRALGFIRFYTYTLQEESGVSLKAAGWTVDAELPAREGWNTPSRPRDNSIKRPKGPKYRWIWEAI